MIENFKKQLETFAHPDRKNQALEYLKKYWLNDEDYSIKWKPLQDQIFLPNVYFPNMVFKPNLEIFILGGGLIFNQNDFETFKTCMSNFGDTNFIVVQQIDENDPPQIYSLDNGWKKHPHLQFEFPSNIIWEELLSGDGVSQEVFEKPYKEYILMGNTGNWGMYVANDYKYPLVIFGCHPKYKKIFRGAYTVTDEERNQISKALPLDYKKYF